MSEKNIKIETESTAYTRNAVLNSKKYERYRYLLSSVLSDTKTYKVKEIDSIIDKFMKGKVV